MVWFVFGIGLAAGSFLNAYIWRLRQGRSAWRGRSICPHCHKMLRWYELVPLLSFIIQRGRCRACAGKIDWQYPIVELVMGVLFVLTYFKLGPPHNILHSTFYILHFYLLAALVILFVYDLRYGLVPDRVVLPAIGVAVLYTILSYRGFGSQFYILHFTFYIFSIAIGAGFFALQYYVSRGRWLGSGDIRIGALMGAMLGWPLIGVGLVVSYIIGGVVALGLIVARKKQWGQTLPLGTFLTSGTVIVFVYGQQIWNWYWQI